MSSRILLIEDEPGLVLTLSGTGQLIALGLLAAITLLGELRSISALIERTPVLRELDSWGRPS